jgi:hypothetical protein
MTIVGKEFSRCSGCAETTWSTEISLPLLRNATNPDERGIYLMNRGPRPNSDARVRPK